MASFLYILEFFANIIIVLIFAIILFSLLVFPLFVNVKICLLSKNKKLFFVVQLFSFIKLIGGYIEILEGDGIIIHLSKRKATIIDKKSILSMGKKVKPLKDYHVIKFEVLIELGAKNSELLNMETAFIINFAFEIAKWLIYNKKPYVKFDRRINIYEELTDTNLFVNSVFLLNLLMIVLSLIKIMVGKIIYAISRRKQPN